MVDKPFEVGLLVLSQAGRDQGRFFIVSSIIDEKYVEIVDGDLRRIDRPKRKKIKHLKSQNIYLEKLAEKFIENKKIFDAEVKSALRPYNG